MIPTNLFRASILLLAALGLAGCGDDADGNQACPIGSHDGGDGTCVPEGSCSEGNHDAGNGACVSDEGPCPAGFATSGKNDLCCAVGYHDGGVGTCVVGGRCSAGYVENEGGECDPESERPPGPPQIDAPVHVSAGESYTASVKNPVTTSTYTWDIGGGVLEADTGLSVTFAAGSSGAVTLSCFETTKAGTKGEVGTATSIILAVPGTPGIAALISAGSLHTCAVTTDGRVRCWGANGSGQLGDGGWDDSATPVEVADLRSSVTAISAGGEHTCALATDGSVRCWGDNRYGQLGDGTTNTAWLPATVTNLSSVTVAISAGSGHTCALATDGGVRCWGYNDYGQLGDGTTDRSRIPVEVTNLSSSASAIAAALATPAR